MLAAAKINLYLHIEGRRDDGYHTLDSLVAFCPDIADEVIITPAQAPAFSCEGPYAHALDGAADNDNLVMQAARAFSALTGHELNCHITLHKNLPVAAGIGGGSSDAAACIHALAQFWGITDMPDGLDTMLLALGADVPACFAGKGIYMRGIGEDITPLDTPLPDLHAVLINPNVPCPTPPIFKALHASDFSGRAANAPRAFDDTRALVHFLSRQGNDLTRAARDHVPVIRDVLFALQKTQNCAITRMSGSGPTCFGLYYDHASAAQAAKMLSAAHPKWWVRNSSLR
ncbi:MAG: 4-(cytidine 5'-diphospho)-2-C-methyl-D-erythritol kinase [Alphaproteobacteria bacterium]|nr:4-(cytidine 5'-diphospho)-2-C-methyl-D-erythritol kinase [Alphaproteobacteria bacterium]